MRGDKLECVFREKSVLWEEKFISPPALAGEAQGQNGKDAAAAVAATSFDQVPPQWLRKLTKSLLPLIRPRCGAIFHLRSKPTALVIFSHRKKKQKTVNVGHKQQ